MTGPCVKATVRCTLVTPAGERFVGENWCANPQAVCPRAPGEGYEKCKSICAQEGHAETVALRVAGLKANGAHAYVEGHTYACRPCQEALFSSGIVALTIGAPPSAPDVVLVEGVVISNIGGFCPVQAEGTVDGLPFYFRGRGRRWTLSVAQEADGDPVDVCCGEKAGFHYEETYGEDPFAAGWMSEPEVRAFINAAVGRYRAAA